jgi:two-component system, NarL family, response regulator NreC
VRFGCGIAHAAPTDQAGRREPRETRAGVSTPSIVTAHTSKQDVRPSLVIADDHKIVRDGLRHMVERSGEFRVVGDAGDGRSLVELVGKLEPDVVVTDMAMGELNGLEATRQLRARGYPGVIIMLSMHDERRHVAEALAAGVNGYVDKDDAFTELLEAIKAARTGHIWLSADIKKHVEGNHLPTLPELLSPREREVLQLFAEGKGTKEIADALQLSPKTIEIHRLNLFAKLKVNNVVDLTRIALKEGFAHL